jgi:uncharacterized protein (TIGR02001 family)
MNRIYRGLGACALLVAATATQAQLSSTLTATTDYDFRGISQSAKDPALQASLDYEFPNGFAVGAWASNVDFGDDVDADIEFDLYANYSRAINDDMSWSLGATFYSYPGSDDVSDYPELYVGLDSGKFSFKQWYSDNYLKADAGSAWYTDGNATFELSEGFALLVHAGYSWGDFWDESLDDGGGGGALFDYSIGVGYDWDNFNLNLKLTGTDASGDQKVTSDVFNNEPRLVFTVSTTLPWGED